MIEYIAIVFFVGDYVPFLGDTSGKTHSSNCQESWPNISPKSHQAPHSYLYTTIKQLLASTTHVDLVQQPRRKHNLAGLVPYFYAISDGLVPYPYATIEWFGSVPYSYGFFFLDSLLVVQHSKVIVYFLLGIMLFFV